MTVRSLITSTTNTKANPMTFETIRPEDLIFGCTDESTALVVDDYPYGFRLRTQIRYWLETTKRGDRFCSQTLNPKTDRWNKPKKSTYSPVGVMYIDAESHVTWTSLSIYSEEPAIEEFQALVRVDKLSTSQRDRLAELIGARRAMRDVTFSIHEGPMSDEDKAEQAKIQLSLRRRAGQETAKARDELS